MSVLGVDIAPAFTRSLTFSKPLSSSIIAQPSARISVSGKGLDTH